MSGKRMLPPVNGLASVAVRMRGEKLGATMATPKEAIIINQRGNECGRLRYQLVEGLITYKVISKESKLTALFKDGFPPALEGFLSALSDERFSVTDRAVIAVPIIQNLEVVGHLAIQLQDCRFRFSIEPDCRPELRLFAEEHGVPVSRLSALPLPAALPSAASLAWPQTHA